ncbi:hypothetical protein OG478_22145 [Streptomyces phaeochromogenes]|uniref:CdiI immunity protein domain-containing protein n=1 Tax=Streptomyces phaeochromogenes TaxID=1923 RepID=A0ABZ1HAX2_STRPH|nr:hypothetical protein [Streptomyces phaeochromogenes]WRZ30035.1 hypothetical protein OG931_20930 [Streptomyces phaeochromogenes]WSD15712.1 hypothetical protein OHB35_22035 [Streptomyces phaeochromogenes]WSS94239.1 hypothetical protein OG478_22145 [Streptomyces phaeochromogenes]
MRDDIRFLEELVAAVPEFGELYEIHVENNGEPLPHVFFGLDVTPAVVDSYLGKDPEGPDWRATLEFLEEQSELQVPAITEVIVTSFFDNLPFRGEPGHGIVEHLGPVMAAAFRRAGQGAR